MSLQLEDLAALDTPGVPSSGQPLMLAVDSIDEDPEQPRHDFDANALQDLAATIRQRGVRQPISVRPNLQLAGRWLLNFGARRLRASRLAGVEQIPAFVDTTADSYDQLIENEQREGLKPLELALFVQKRLALGDTQAEIAQRLGKSRQWVTLTTALIEPPDWMLQIYRQGRCRGLNELYELRRLHGEHPASVETWAAAQRLITRDRLTLLRDELEVTKQGAGPEVQASSSRQPRGGAPDRTCAQPDDGQANAEANEPEEPAKPRFDHRVHVEFDGQDYQLVVSVAPAVAGHMYVRPLNGGPRRLARATHLKLLGFVDW